MNIDNKIAELKQLYNVVDVVNLNQWNTTFQDGRNWLEHTCRAQHKDTFEDNERIIFIHDADFY